MLTRPIPIVSKLIYTTMTIDIVIEERVSDVDEYDDELVDGLLMSIQGNTRSLRQQ